MSIDTEIEGSPASLRATGGWLRDDVAATLDDGVDHLLHVGRQAEAAWEGQAGEAFSGTVRTLAAPVDSAQAKIGGVGDSLLAYADRLESLQSRMAAERERARAAGLTVSGYVVESPGPGPGRPPTPPANARPGELAAFDQAVAAHDEHVALVQAYEDIRARVREIREDEEAAVRTVWDVERDLTATQWGMALGDALSTVAAKTAGARLRGVMGKALLWQQRAHDSLDALLASEKELQKYAQAHAEAVERGRANAASAADDVAQASRWAETTKRVGAGLGAAFFLGGVAYDMTREGDAREGLGQAVASNGGSMVASMVAGGAVGTAFGGPVGTVAGVVVGFGVGVFTSGMIDGLWKYDGDLSDALKAGADALLDTGAQVVGGLTDVGGAVVDGISGWLD
ncbi:hypothetical protein [Nocardioides solisilvae]|uniref:hypothetical protein n=1 Tax=Nocardioides solisilvae TaxID=1542435 RepID=UPI0019517808|nr:hypothetical protein [Nocardioides solisilvae]